MISDIASEDLLLTVDVGEKRWIRQGFVCAKGRRFEVSVGVVRGSRPGPVLAQIGGQHGTEHAGPIVLRDLFDEIDPTDVSGTLLLCPCANPLALELDYEVYPEFEDLSLLDNYHFSDSNPGHCVFGFGRNPEQGTKNMNRLWPNGGGASAGAVGEIVRWLWKTVVGPADVVIDHHALRSDKPLIFCEDPAVPWTPFLGIEAVYSRPMPQKPDPYNHAVLCLQALLHGKVGICVEYSKQHGFKIEDLAIGRFAVLNLMRAMGMLPGEVEFPRPVWLLGNRFYPPENIVLSTDKIGHLHFRAVENEPVRKGQTLVEIRSIETHEVLDRVVAPSDGLMLTRTWRAVSKPGEEVTRMHTAPVLLASPDRPAPVPPLKTRKEA